MSPLPNFQGGCRALFLNGGCRALFLDGGLQGTLFRWGGYRALFPWNVSQSIEILSAPSPFSKFGRGSTPLPSLQKGDWGFVFLHKKWTKIWNIYFGGSLKNLFFKGGRAFMKNQYMGGIAWKRGEALGQFQI